MLSAIFNWFWYQYDITPNPSLNQRSNAYLNISILRFVFWIIYFTPQLPISPHIFITAVKTSRHSSYSTHNLYLNMITTLSSIQTILDSIPNLALCRTWIIIAVSPKLKVICTISKVLFLQWSQLPIQQSQFPYTLVWCYSTDSISKLTSKYYCNTKLV